MTHVVCTSERGRRLYVTCLVFSAPVAADTLAALAAQHADAQDTQDGDLCVPRAAHLPCAVGLCTAAPIFSFARVWLRLFYTLASRCGASSPAVSSMIASLIHQGLRFVLSFPPLVSSFSFITASHHIFFFSISSPQKQKQFHDHCQEEQKCK